MLAAGLWLLAIAIVARAWRAGRAADPARVRPTLVRFAISSVAVRALLPAVAGASGGGRIALLAAAGLAALVAFDALASLALWGPFRRPGLITRAVLLGLAALLALVRAPWGAVVTFGALGFISYRWRAALGTVALFRVALGASVLTAFLILLPSGEAATVAGPLRPLATFARIVMGIARIYAVLAIFKTFTAFTRDPSLGIRTVTRRLALSHVLVLAVPLAITLTLWVATTFLGVNAERALAGRQLLEHEAAQLGAGLTAAVRADGGGAATRLVEERDRRWKGTRLWLDGGAGLERVFGDSIPGEAMLAAWPAGLDTLPAHGVVGLRGRRWLGAAVRDSARRRAAIVLTPIRSTFDSTLSPVLQARYSMHEGDVRERAGEDSLEALADSLSSMLRDVQDVRSRRGREAGRRGRIRVTGEQKAGPLVVNDGSRSDTLGTSESLASAGMVVARGLELQRGRWRRSEFMLIARGDPGATLAGLFANLRQNPLQAVPVAILGLIAMLLLPVAVLDFSMVGGMGRSIAQAVGALRDGASALGRGELAHRIEIRGQDDLWETARQFNRMAEGLERAQALEKERARLESELELARRIQQRLLPDAPPAVPGLEIAGKSEPAREVGGDYYDHFDLGGGRVLLVIADVSGKGVPAALLMSGFRASLMSQDAQALGPDRIAGRVNEFLHRSVETGKFVTAFLGFLEAGTGRLVYANAGHNPPALLKADGSVEWLSAGGLVLGIMAHSRFESGETTIAPGDLLALYTDGVTEGINAAGDLWGEDRLVEALGRLRDRPCADAAEALVREVRAFEGETGPADDITVLLARRI